MESIFFLGASHHILVLTVLVFCCPLLILNEVKKIHEFPNTKSTVIIFFLENHRFLILHVLNFTNYSNMIYIIQYNYLSIKYLRPQKLHRNGFPPWCKSMCCFKLAGVKNFLLHIWHRLHPFALLAGSLLFGEFECVDGWEFNERTGDRGKDLLRKTTPPKDPRMCLVTFPLPTAILV